MYQDVFHRFSRVACSAPVSLCDGLYVGPVFADLVCVVVPIIIRYDLQGGDLLYCPSLVCSENTENVAFLESYREQEQ